MPSNPYAPPQAAVRDVTDPAFAMTMADRGTRFAAWLLDSIIFGAMVYGPFLFGAFIAGAVSGATNGSDEATATAALTGALVITGIGFIAWLWLTLRFLSQNGQSIGKKLLNIKTVRSDGSRASLARIVWMRNVLNWIVSIVPLYGIIDALFIFGDDRQCLHDKIADTIVINA